MKPWGLSKGQQTFSVKIQIVKTLPFVGHMISIATTELSFSSVNAAIDNTQTGVAVFQ